MRCRCRPVAAVRRARRRSLLYGCISMPIAPCYSMQALCPCLAPACPLPGAGTRPQIEKLPDRTPPGHVHSLRARTERNENGGFANCWGRSIKLLLVRCHIYLATSPSSKVFNVQRSRPKQDDEQILSRRSGRTKCLRNATIEDLYALDIRRHFEDLFRRPFEDLFRRPLGG